MTDLATYDRAALLARMAPHESITSSVLLDGEAGDEPSRLSGPPPIERLGDSEAPAYALTNEGRGIAVGTKDNRTRPDDGYGTIVLVTGRRTLGLVGRSSGDAVVEIPHGSVGEVATHSGLLARRLELRTPTGAYHCWVPRSVGAALLEETARFVDDHEGLSEEDPTLPERAASTRHRAANGDGPEGETTITYRGREVDPSYLE